MKKDDKKYAALLLLLLLFGGLFYAGRRTGGHPFLSQAGFMPEAVALPSSYGPHPAYGPEPVSRQLPSHATAVRLFEVRGPDQMMSADSARPGSSLLVIAGLDVSDHAVLPVVGLGYAVATGTSVGFFFSGASNLFGQKVRVFGGGLSATQFLYGDARSGGWLADFSVCAYRITGRNAFRTSTASPLAFSTTVGWTGSLSRGLTLGLGAGVQYAFNGGRNIGDIKFNGLMPLLKVRLGQDL